ncbi:potassium-transporting ATPase subunit KdpB [Terribacillus sp. DMT04]|uniref:potassium-transporting ATPase subunit KdpB n=1 Tax=Terribacillus sp. DMT04 TaxID=2850441 RepID=UPI00352FA05F
MTMQAAREESTSPTRLFTKNMIKNAFVGAVVKLNPVYMVKNPILFIVELGFIITVLLAILPDNPSRTMSSSFYWSVSFILLLTVLFANAAESVAEGRGKAQADTLKHTKQETQARRVSRGKEVMIASAALRKGDIVRVKEGEVIPGDGTIIAGIASVDESAITGESAPVLKEAGGDFNSVTGGTTIISDELTIEITSQPGESFLDRMIALVEGADRKKTPNEIALNTVLISLTIIFMFVVITLPFFTNYIGFALDTGMLVALLVCLIPTTIGGLLSAIGIAGMDRVTRFNVLAKSGRAVEAAGDIDTIILDKTGTITFGNRMAAAFIPLQSVSAYSLMQASVITSWKDETPEGRSVISLANARGVTIEERGWDAATFVPFQAETKMSGIDLAEGGSYRKGAVAAVQTWVTERGGSVPADLKDKAESIAKEGGTPLAVAVDTELLGLIYLKDTVKPGMRERFDELRQMGIKTVMCTGDNPLTAATIAKEAGVDDYIAESTPEDKIEVIKREQAQGKLVAMTGDGTNDAPALAQADVGIAMNSGTTAAKEAANMIDLDSDPTKMIEVVAIGKQLLMTRGALTTFSIANDLAKYFAIIPALFMLAIPEMNALNIMQLESPASAILSALLFNGLIIPALVPLAIKGVAYKPVSADKLLRKNLFIYGLGGVLIPFLGIKVIDLILSSFL